MTWLFLDTHSPKVYQWGWVNLEEGTVDVHTCAERARCWLPRLEAVCRRPDGIVVVAGPGSFSAIRLGVLQANLLSRLWRIPLIAIHTEDAKDRTDLPSLIRARMQTPLTYVAPLYEMEPHITISRSS